VRKGKSSSNEDKLTHHPASEELSEEDQKLKSELDMLAERIQVWKHQLLYFGVKLTRMTGER
jgi:hypothetical protein